MTTAKERPMLFSGAMVRAILEGRKTQTRRVIKPQPIHGESLEIGVYAPTVVNRYGEYGPGKEGWGASNEYECIRCPYGMPGDRLWVRESFQKCGCDGCQFAWPEKGPHGIAGYRATYSGPSGAAFQSPIYIPRWASRLTLEVTEVRVQRVQEISEEDAKAEGTQEPSLRDLSAELKQAAWSERQVFQRLWDSINGKTHPWSANHWVWAVTFRRVEQERV